MLEDNVKIKTGEGVMKMSHLVPGLKIQTPQGLKAIISVQRSRRSKLCYKFITHDSKEIECTSRQYFFLRDGGLIKASKIVVGTWLKTRKANVKIKDVIQILDKNKKFTTIIPSSNGGLFYLDNDILTLYKL